MNHFTPTTEQKKAIAYGSSGVSLKIEAGAGCTKTSTLVLVAQNLPARRYGHYITFGAANVRDAKSRMPKHITCKTAHGEAWCIGRDFADRVNQRLNGRIIAEQFRITNRFFGDASLELSASVISNLSLDAVTRFCQTSDIELSEKHIPLEHYDLTDELKQDIGRTILFYAKKLWLAMSDKNSTFPSTHNIYLKLWSLSNPVIKTDLILFDEAQDANEVMLSIVLAQKHCQLIFVGDRYQSIFEWNGAINAMNKIELDKETKLTQSFRFGDDIAQLGNQVIDGFLNKKINLKGNPAINSQVVLEDYGRCDAVISRTNASMIGSLLENQMQGYRAGVNGGTKESELLLSGIQNLMDGVPVTVKDLMLFKNYNDLIDYSETNSGQDMKTLLKLIDRYGINTLRGALKNTINLSDPYLSVKPDVILTTAHRAKGLEFETVKLSNDFKSPDDEGFQDADAHLLYVACTRAKKRLDISGCRAAQQAWLNHDNHSAQSFAA